MADSSPLRILNADPLTKTERETSRPVVLIGFQEQANLGLGYLASYLRQHGYTVEVLDFELDRRVILETVRALDPVLVGFSLIFQFYIFRFGSLIRFLRDHGVASHFTMGGHFPSLSYSHALELIPELDSVVRFEGEVTLLDLVDCLSVGRNWREIQGIAYRERRQVVPTTLRPLIHDLDALPYPDRSGASKNMVLGRLATPILASRGCARTCSFCSIHMFYRAAPGKVVRTRRPAEVVKEMQMLNEQHGITILCFQDDDFPLFGPVWQRWAGEFVNELHRSGLPGRVIWKINCRADAVDAELLARMREAGLYLVYMGLESGTEEGLRTLHKQITVHQNLRAVRLLKRLGLMFQYGFMLFDPSSTFESVLANVRFLRSIVGDGSAAATFCRMVPYDGTPIKDELARSGRLRGDVCHPDYGFRDPRLDTFYDELRQIVDVAGWIHGYQALSPQLNFAWNEVAILRRLFPALPDLLAYTKRLRRITGKSNELLFRVVEEVSRTFTEGKKHDWSGERLKAECEQFLGLLHVERNTFVHSNQNQLLRALAQPPETVCA